MHRAETGRAAGLGAVRFLEKTLMQRHVQLHADVILPLPLRKTLTYRIPEAFSSMLEPGMRVCVPLGGNKLYAGIVLRIHENAPAEGQERDILSVMDEKPVVTALQLRFWEWMAKYYLCTLGEVMAAALPSGFKLDSQTRLVLNPEFDGDVSSFNERQLAILSALLQKGELDMGEASQVASQAKVFPLVRGLREKGAVLLKEEIGQRYRPLEETVVRWADLYRENPGEQQALFDKIEKRSPRQLAVVLAYMSLCGQAEGGWVPESAVSEKAKGSHEALRALVRKGVFERAKREKSRLEDLPGSGEAAPARICLSEHQEAAFRQIGKGLQEKNVCLLHGVTSSGKTEIYMHLMRQVLSTGKQVLFLLPEIALSAQMIHRLRRYFGNDAGVYHSRYNEPEKVEIWNHAGTRYRIILGARSALFLPFRDLGLVIVDEEHDTSYKQQDPAPRYQARDAAIYLASLHGAKTVLGSATPSLETYYNALHGKYALATLFTRYGGVKLPEILVSNLKEEKKQKTMKGNFSSLLVEKIRRALSEKKQVILFQNRRGFSTRIECESCGYVPVCERCDVTLTYHKARSVLMCHYCGYTLPVPRLCPRCANPGLRLRGFGTERIEDDLALLFPEAKTGRMDLDSTRAKGAYHRIIEAFQNRKIDILVGTQMVTKGLDFDNVAVVGIVDADGLISFPDFRSYERSFQLMTQVSGRAGRKGGGGEVVIQTYNPDYQVIVDVMNNDYASMYQHQLQDRLQFQYPPFYRLVRLSVRHKDAGLVWQAAQDLAAALRAVFPSGVLGPEFPMVSRINLYHIRDILLKQPRSASVEEWKRALAQVLEAFSAEPAYRSVRVVADVDP